MKQPDIDNYEKDEEADRYKRTNYFRRLTAEQRDLILSHAADGWLTYEIEMLDVWTGKVHSARNAYMPTEFDEAMEDWTGGVQQPPAFTINQHMITSHFCGCHRESAILDQSAIDQIHGKPEDEGCPDDRWYILKTSHVALPEFNLYFELPKLRKSPS